MIGFVITVILITTLEKLEATALAVAISPKGCPQSSLHM